MRQVGSGLGTEAERHSEAAGGAGGRTEQDAVNMVVTAIVGVMSHGMKGGGGGGCVWALLLSLSELVPALSLPVALVKSMGHVQTPPGRARALLRLAMSDRSSLLYRGDSLIRNCRPPQDHHRTLGIVLL